MTDADAAGGRPEAIGCSGQMHTLMVSDNQGHPLYPAILWSDTRPAPLAAAVARQYEPEALTPPPRQPAVGSVYLVQAAVAEGGPPDLWPRIRHVAVAKDWLRQQLTGRWQAEVSDAAGTYLLDVAGRRWANDWLAEHGIAAAWLGSDPTESAAFAGTVTIGPARWQGIPVVAGAGDQPAGAAGTGVWTPDRAMLAVGTSGVILHPRAAFTPAPTHRPCLLPCPPGHLVCDGGQSGGGRFPALAACHHRPRIPLPGAGPGGGGGAAGGGRPVLPALLERRAGPWRPSARPRGILGAQHRAQPGPSVLEGVACNLRQTAELMGVDREVRWIATGGGTTGRLWPAILAAVLNRPLTVVGSAGVAGKRPSWPARRCKAPVPFPTPPRPGGWCTRIPAPPPATIPFIRNTGTWWTPPWAIGKPGPDRPAPRWNGRPPAGGRPPSGPDAATPAPRSAPHTGASAPPPPPGRPGWWCPPTPVPPQCPAAAAA
ncbi:putative Xylulokinase [Candidatus Hydrogenisulfobacillus filiaventi]|uniref:Putative Xylulokinase n=1 Tax=Candidatus Hydrogenisulfobacillus filiaventi TaxID=2707344 RepID=A0A6F8ZDR5_9FIRM|nr:putative Xylulokinase [Candidatus Hydrogenisulfobacillus filiaventi]